MKTKINKISTAAIACIFAATIFTVVAWSTVASNAFAAEDEAAEEVAAPTNELPTVNYAFAPEEGRKFCRIGQSTLYKDHSYYKCYLNDYNFSQEISVCAEPNSEELFSIMVDTELSHLSGYDFDGFYINDTKINDGDEIHTDTTVEVRYAYTGKLYYSIIQFVRDGSQSAYVPGMKVTVFDKNANRVGEGLTNSGGNCTLTDLPESIIGGTIFVEGEGWADSFEQITSEMFTYSRRAQIIISAFDDSNVNFILDSKDPNHNLFKISIKFTSPELPEPIIQNIIAPHYRVPGGDVLAGTFKVLEEGELYSKQVATSGAVNELTIQPVLPDGYTTEFWSAEYLTNFSKDLYPGNEIVVPQEAKYLSFYSNYKKTPDPDPDPTPTPASEEVVASAQTGDSTAAIPLAILAATCVVVLIASRKRDCRF